MQITINIPDNLPDTFLQKEIKFFEKRLKKLKNRIAEKEAFKINEKACLSALEKIKQGDKSDLTELGNIDDYIENLKHEIAQN
jgi:hypothetical protein